MTSPLSHLVVGFLGNIDWKEILLLLLVLMLLFGGKKLPELARGLGKSIREFKKASTEAETEAETEPEPEPAAPKNNGASKPGVGANTSSTK